MANILISDFSYTDMPHGGSEVGNQMLIEEFNLDFIGSRDIKSFSKDDFYIISNISLMLPHLVKQIKNYNYIIFECDYKIVASRHPWRYPNDIIPIGQRINYDLYENAKAVFVKSTDHLCVYEKNDVKGNFINMKTNIWSESDLQLMERLLKQKTNSDNSYNDNGKFCIYNTNNWIKNTKGAVEWVKKSGYDEDKYGFIQNGTNREDFLFDMSKYNSLVFFPLARETYCRIVIEAKCLGLNVLTTYLGVSSTNSDLNNYGAPMEDYFHLKGLEMIKYLRIGNKMNIKKMRKYIPNVLLD